MTNKESSLKDLHITEEFFHGIVVVRSNPDISTEDRANIVSIHRLDQLTQALGRDATLFFRLKTY